MQTKAPGYLLRVADDELDLARFQRLVRRREAARRRSRSGAARRSPSSPTSGFAQGEIARLEELHLGCLEQRIEHDLAAGRHAELVGELEALVAEHPLREQLTSSADARALSLGEAGGGARRLPRSRRRPRRRAGDRARPLAARARAGDPASRTRALDVTSADDGAREITESRGAFVGREAELNELRGGLEAAVAGRGRLVPGLRRARHRQEPAG